MATQVINLNNTTPAAPEEAKNIFWQADPPSLDPTVVRNVSAYVPDPEPPFVFQGKNTNKVVVTVEASQPTSSCSFVQANAAVTASYPSIAFNANVTRGNWLLVAFYEATFGSLDELTVEDSLGNAYSLLAEPGSESLTLGGGGVCNPLYLFGCISQASGPCTVSIASAGGTPEAGSIAVLEYEVAIVGLDVDEVAINVYHNSPTPPSLTQTFETDQATLILAIGASIYDPGFPVQPSGFTSRVNAEVAVLDMVQEGAASVEASWEMEPGTIYPSMMLIALKLGEIAGQTSDLLDFEDAEGNFISGVNSQGQFVLPSTEGSPTNSPAEGALAFDSTAHAVKVFADGEWSAIGGSPGGSLTAPLLLSTGAPGTIGIEIEGTASSTVVPPALVQVAKRSSAGSSSAASAFTDNVTLGNAIIVLVTLGPPYFGSPVAPTVSDTLGNSFSLIASNAGVSDETLYIFAAVGIAAGADTVTAAGGFATDPDIVAFEFSGLATSIAALVDTSVVGSGGALSSPQVFGAVTTSEYDLLLTILVANTTSAAATGFTSLTTVDDGPTQNFSVAYTSAPAGTYTPSWTSATTGEAWSGTTLALKAAVGGSGQVADLLQFQAPGGSVLSAFNSAGQLVLPSSSGIPTNAPTVGALAFDSESQELVVYTTAGWGPLAAGTDSPSASLVVTGGGSQNISPAFSQIDFSTIVTDSAGGFSLSTNLYTIPTTGIYMIVTKLRLNDGVTSGVSYGVGANNVAEDGSWFSWFVTAPSRNGAINTRIVHLTAATTIMMYAYCDDTLAVAGAEMDIVLLSTP